jgi:hypothetical protein
MRPQHEDVGAALILAVGFFLMVGVIGGGLAALATTGVNSRNALTVVRDRQYAADGAIEEAISQVRRLTCESPGSSVDDTLNGVAITVDWVTDCDNKVLAADEKTLVDQRNVIFSAHCTDPKADNCSFTGVIIRAQVNFQTSPDKTYIQSWSVNR